MWGEEEHLFTTNRSRTDTTTMKVSGGDALTY